MNFPMIYWFVPRELVWLVKAALIGLLLLGLVLVLRGLFDKTKSGPARWRKIAWFFGLVVLPVGGWLAYNEVQERKEIEARRQYVKDAWAHFRKRCETAHVSYYRKVPPQDGVFIMKPAQEPTMLNMQDQFWPGDVFDLPNKPDDEARWLLYRQKSGRPDGRRGGFDFVEMVHPDQPGKFIRYVLKPYDRVSRPGRSPTDTSVVERRESRYGYTWDDISTREDRHYWVAGGRLRVVELESGDVVAQRVGWVIEPSFGVHSPTFNQEPWRSAQKCAIRISVYSDWREFISTALGTWNELSNEGESK